MGGERGPKDGREDASPKARSPDPDAPETEAGEAEAGEADAIASARTELVVSGSGSRALAASRRPPVASVPSELETYVGPPSEGDPYGGGSGATHTDSEAPTLHHDRSREGPGVSVTRPTGAGASWDALHRGAVPDAIGRFKISRRLGAGGMGMVFEGRDETLERKVAVKLLRLDDTGSQSDEASARLLREAQALARVTHPNVIQVFEVGTWRDQVFVAMEYIDGCTFEEWQRDPDLAWPEILRAYLDAGRGLAAAHAAGIVHRDFKPSNVMRANDGRVVVLDFGLARDTNDLDTAGDSMILARAAQSAASLARRALTDPLGTPLTATGAVMGTPAYMAPEQHAGTRTDARTDQFSFCVSLYEALYGERPFSGGSLAVLASSVLEGRVRPVPEFTRVPIWIREVLIRGLDVEPDARFADMNALLGELDRVPVGRRGRWRRWAAVGAISLATAGATWTARRSIDLEPARARVAAVLASATLERDALEERGAGTSADAHWDALVLAHARESVAKDPTMALASLRHLTPGETHWVPAARVLAARARDEGAAWRQTELGDARVRSLWIAGLGDLVVGHDSAGGAWRWDLDDDRREPIRIEAGVRALTMASAARSGAVVDGEGRFWELSLIPGERTELSEMGLQSSCERPRLVQSAEARHLIELCEGSWRHFVRGGRGWTERRLDPVEGEIFDARATEHGAWALVRGGGQQHELWALGDALARGDASGDEGSKTSEEMEASWKGAERVALAGRARAFAGGARIDSLAVDAGDGVLRLDAKGSKLERLGATPKSSSAEVGAAGLAWADGAQVVVDRGYERRRFRGHPAPITRIVAATLQPRVVSLDASGVLRVWRPGRGGARLREADAGGIEVMSSSADGRVVYTASGDGTVRRIELASGDQPDFEDALVGKMAGAVRTLVASPAGGHVAAAGENPGVRVWARGISDPVVFAREQQPARALAWSRDGSRVAAGTCTTAEGCGLWVAAPDGSVERSFVGPARAPKLIAFSRSGRRVAAVEPEEDGSYLWTVDLDDDDDEMERLRGRFGRVAAMAFDEDEALWVLWQAQSDGDLRLWKIDDEGRGGRVGHWPDARALQGDDGSQVSGSSGAAASSGAWAAWVRDRRVELLNLETMEAMSVRELPPDFPGEGVPWSDTTPPVWTSFSVRRGGDAVALYEAERGDERDVAWLVDFASRESRPLEFGVGPRVWGAALVDAPGPYLRAITDMLPRDPERFMRWLERETRVWVEPSTMHRSMHEGRAGGNDPSESASASSSAATATNDGSSESAKD